MNRTLEARLRARERKVTAGGHEFTVRRPKAAEIIEGLDGLDLVRRFTVGWNLTAADLVPGGNPDPEPFDPALFADYYSTVFFAIVVGIDALILEFVLLVKVHNCSNKVKK